jgi:two-component system, chemotaxis family, chemotaxis protein CheY
VKTIMTVDDSASLRQMVTFVLRDGGYQIVEAVDGVDALSKLKGQEIDLFLSDVNMPNMDGLELTRKSEPWLSTSSSRSFC